MEAEPAVSVIVPARDASQTIGRTLEALAKQTVEGGFEVVVVDNGSRDDTAALAEGAGAKVIRLPRGEGPSAARNRGAAAARGSVLAFTDADCAPVPGWLAAGLEALADADLLQGRVTAEPDVPCGPFDRSLWVPRADGLFQTANLFVRRGLFERVGGFEEIEAGPSADAAPLGEDVWFGWRALRCGARSAFSPEALVYHAVFPRGRPEFVAERRRLRYFPVLARLIPELREAFFYRRFFLSPRTAAFDVALVGSLIALRRRRPAWLLVAAPYAVLLSRRATRGGSRRAVAVAVADMAADGVGLAALLRGSLRARTLVL